MLRIITGRSGSGKTEEIHRRLCQEPMQKRIILLVPEQSTYQNEKRILDTLGAKKASHIQVLSFKRLYDTVNDLYGNNRLKRIDDGAKSVLMSIASEEVSDQLVLYRTRCKKGDFADLMVNAISEFKMCGIQPQELYEAAHQAESMRLRHKLRESALVYESYEALLNNAYSDPDDDLTRLYELLQKNPYFEGTGVYIDAFNGFSGQEKKILKCILQQSDEVCISLCCDNSHVKDMGNSIFYEPDRTLLEIRRMAADLGIETEPVIRMEQAKRFRSESIKAIEESIFRFDGDPYDYEDGTVSIYEATDEYDEVQQAAREITRLVRDLKYAYRDIVVVYRDANIYKDIIISEFPKYDLPFFISNPQPLDEKPLIRMILSAFDIVHNSFNTENILTYLKTDLTCLTQDEVYELENYVYLWDIKGSRWKKPFTMNPNGNSDTIDDKELQRIEELRRRVTEPLMRFSERISDSNNGAEISKAVFELLQEQHTAEKMKQLVKSFEPLTKEKEARIWDITMNLLDQMYTVLSGVYTDSKRYADLLKMMIRKNALSDIPQTLDHVVIGTAGNIRSQRQKVVLILGAAEGVFPAVPVSSGLFSESERSALIGMELPLYDTVYELSLKEKFNAYTALTMPSERLYISRYLTNTAGDNCEPSVIIKEIQAILPKVTIKRYSDLKNEEKYFTEKQTFEECAAQWRKKTPESAALKKHYAASEQYSERFAAITRLLSDEPYRITDKGRTKKLFGDSMTISASQTETYYQCPFKYFCRYGLKAYPRKKAAMDAGMYGSAVHYILEQLFRNNSPEVLKEADEVFLSGVIQQYIQSYIKEIGGNGERTNRFMAQFNIIERNITVLIKRMIEELKEDCFIPTDFELEIGENGNIPQYELSLPTGEKIGIIGKVDRVDTFIKDSQKYIRIMDYKTGNKKFRMSDVLYGLNIQMLLYLSVIYHNGVSYYSEANKYQLAPAGILYMPSTPNAKTGEYRSEQQEKAALKDQQTSLKMNGLLIDDPEILSAMESSGAGVFIPARIGKDGKISGGSQYLANVESYGHIFSYIDKKLISMAEGLYNGKVERMPVKGSDTDSCEYCDYKTVCGYEEGKSARQIINRDNKAAIEIIDREEENTNE